MDSLNGKVSGLKIRSVNAILMVATCLLSIAVLICSFEFNHRYNSMVFGVSDYTDCTKAINDFKDSSEYLTNQVRLFTIHKDFSFMKNYFDELNVFKRREHAIEVLAMSHMNDDTINNLKRAMEESNELKQREFYAMALVCDAIPSYTALPEEIKNYQLPSSDKLLDAQEKLEKSQEILFDVSYINSKERISKYTTAAFFSLSSAFSDQLIQDDKRLSTGFIVQQFICGLLLCLSVASYFMLIKLVIIPLKSHIMNIKNGQPMEYTGSYELKYIAKTYNELCEKNIIKESILRHKAEHDPLTDLINRDAFNQIKDVFKASDEQIAFLLVDIDFFKKINDTYGHLVGDKVLKKIAKLLSEQFRNTDYVARIGGDEFAVIMTKFGDNPETVIQRKIDGLNKTLQLVTDGLPPVSLSVGVSFSESGFREVLEEQADKALYRVKNGGRCNCSFYDYIELN